MYQSILLFSKHCNTDRLFLKKKVWEPKNNMSEEHKMTKQDKLVLTITLAAIFFGVFALGLIGLIINLSS